MKTQTTTGRSTHKPATPQGEKRAANARLTKGREGDHVRAPGVSICPTCQAVWEHKRWRIADEAFVRLVAAAGVAQRTCPACKQIAGRQFDAHLVLEGELLESRRDEVVHLILATERELRRDNPMFRLAAVVPGQEALEVWTIGTHLAERLGRAIERAFGGELTVHHDRGDGPMQLHWRQSR